MARLCLNMIVRNEAERIERALDSAAPHITCWVIGDTGSTDGTPEIIEKFFKHHRIPGKLVKFPFVDFSQARNEALRAARTYSGIVPYDYILLMDADMELRVAKHDFIPSLDSPGYDMYQDGCGIIYQNRRLVNARETGEYVGVTHEHLAAPSGGCIPQADAYFHDYADGSNRKEKYRRDIRLLREGLKKEPNNERYFFYLARSYQDAGDLQKAKEWYKRRIAAGGWEEEVWYAQFCYAHCCRALGDEDGFIREILVAYNMRPQRAETLFDLANHYRLKGMNAAATLIAEAGLHMPIPDDALFVNPYAYIPGCAQEFAISAFYVPSKRRKGFQVNDQLSLLPGQKFAGVREQARQNMWWYLPHLKEACPSFESKEIDFQPEPGWVAMNPSVALHQGKVCAVIRTVNYRMDDDGRYLIGDLPPSDDNPITTRNFFVQFDNDLNVAGKPIELLPHGNLPCEFKAVIGFEDMRLFSLAGELWTSSTMRQLAADGNAEQVLAKIGPDYRMVGVKRMLREPRQTQKNWMPIERAHSAHWMEFMYRLGHNVDSDGKDIKVRPVDIDREAICGGSQVISFGEGYLCIVHESRPLPDRPWKRYYWHRFVYFDNNLRVERLSNPFVFHDKQIEFCAGLCWTPDKRKLIISYGVRDCSARIATITLRDVDKLLWYGSA